VHKDTTTIERAAFKVNQAADRRCEWPVTAGDDQSLQTQDSIIEWVLFEQCLYVLQYPGLEPMVDLSRGFII
jgi:hypothetical protein